jgi:hypothetical protein
MRSQAEVARLAGEKAAQEARADEAEGGLAAAQAEMETSGKALSAELAALRSEAAARAEAAAAQHDAEACPSFLVICSRDFVGKGK